MAKDEKVILVTGANGYIGSHVVTALLDRGVRVIGVDMASDYMDSRAEHRIGNMFDMPMEELLGDCVPDVGIHFAWQDGFQHNAPSHLEKLPWHYRLLTGLAEAGVKHLAVMGSMHEVGYWEGEVTEDTPCNPLSLYGIAKNTLRRAMELYCRQHQVVLQWMRGFYVMGDDERNHSVFSKLLQAVKKGEKTFPFVSGNCQYDFMDVSALAGQIASVVLQTRVQGIINCCSGKPRPIGQVMEEFISSRHYDIRLQYGAYPEREYDSPAIWGSNEKIQTVLTGEHLR